MVMTTGMQIEWIVLLAAANPSSGTNTGNKTWFQGTASDDWRGDWTRTR